MTLACWPFLLQAGISLRRYPAAAASSLRVGVKGQLQVTSVHSRARGTFFPGQCPRWESGRGQLSCSQPVPALWVAAGWLMLLCAVGGQGTAPPPPQLLSNLQVQSDSSSGRGSVWDVLLKCWGDWWAEEMLDVFSCMTGVFCSDSLDKVHVLPFLLFLYSSLLVSPLCWS